MANGEEAKKRPISVSDHMITHAFFVHRVLYMCVGAFVSLAQVAFFRSYIILLTGATGLIGGLIEGAIL